jgi:hypothetical protein
MCHREELAGLNFCTMAKTKLTDEEKIEQAVEEKGWDIVSIDFGEPMLMIPGHEEESGIVIKLSDDSCSDNCIFHMEHVEYPGTFCAGATIEAIDLESALEFIKLMPEFELHPDLEEKEDDNKEDWFYGY